MFGNDLENVKKYLEEIGACYNVYVTNGLEQIYVLDKDAMEQKEKHPKKNQNLYVSYLRISKHDGKEYFYTRQDGLTGYMNDERIKKIIDELTGVRA